MGDGSLSQDEIDALLKGADDMTVPLDSSPAMDVVQKGGAISPVERDSLGSLLNATMEMVVPALSGYLGKNIRITNAVIEVKSQDEVRSDLSRKYVQVSLDFSGGFNGTNLVLFNIGDAEVVSSLMMGDDSGTPPDELTDAHQSTIQEFVSQMISSMATDFTNRFGRSVNISAPSLSIVDNPSDLRLPPGPELVKVTYNLNIENIVTSKLYQVFDLPFSADLAKSAMSGDRGMPQQTSQPQRMINADQGSQVGISPVKFPPLGESVPYGAGSNISLLLDVPMTLTVELGRTKYLVKDILGLGEGSIIELDKLAGEPVDLLVNNKLIAKGEVVVIDENFGVRVTDIVSPAERLNKVQ